MSSGAHWTRGVPGWGPVVPTVTRRWLLRSSGAHWDRELAVEAQQCPLRSGAGEEARGRRRRRRRKARRAISKSNNPHLAGGESMLFSTMAQTANDCFSGAIIWDIEISSSEVVNPVETQRQGSTPHWESGKDECMSKVHLRATLSLLPTPKKLVFGTRMYSARPGNQTWLENHRTSKVYSWENHR